jgi:glutathione peroxidase-family protein
MFSKIDVNGSDAHPLWQYLKAVFRNRIHMFLGLPDPDPLIRCMDPDPAPDSSIKQKYYEKP